MTDTLDCLVNGIRLIEVRNYDEAAKFFETLDENDPEWFEGVSFAKFTV